MNVFLATSTEPVATAVSVIAVLALLVVPAPWRRMTNLLEEISGRLDAKLLRSHHTLNVTIAVTTKIQGARLRADALALGVATLLLATSACTTVTPTHVEVLAGIRHVAPAEAWPLERQALGAIFGALSTQNAERIVVAPISDHSLSETTLLDGGSPTGRNDFEVMLARKAFQHKAEQTLAQLEARSTGSERTEIINAILNAADRFAADPKVTDRMLLLVTSAFEQSSIVNMADYRLELNNAAVRRRLLEHLAATNQIPDLSGVSVCMVGISPAQAWVSDYNRSRGVKLFWQDFFAAAKAEFAGFGADVSACRPLAQLADASR